MQYTADSGKVMQSADRRPANYATIKALHLLSGTVPIEHSFRYLEHAQQAIEGASRAGDYEKVDIEMLQSLREQTAELWSLYEKERAGELSYAWPEPVRDQASGLFINFNKPRREHITLAILGFFLNQMWTLLSLLVVKGTGDAILRSELPASESPREDGKKQIIPKIIHQTYKTTAIPPVWQEVQASGIALHSESEGWEYKLRTDEMGLEFIQQEYERFYKTYAGYEYPIQRADAIR
ncbi:CSG1/SUR1-like protein [Elasticomyces elasticus]|nr:CSG1/SUR1-like protein [Elasticomyces elasticus]KAK5721374.1 CSG1/SUR1-like protein [Elasticomyces elasticus]